MRKLADLPAVTKAFDEHERRLQALERASEPTWLVFGATSLDTASADRYLWPFHAATADATEKQVPSPVGGRISSIMVYVPDYGTAAADRNIDVVLRINAKDTVVGTVFVVPRSIGVFKSKNRGLVTLEAGDLVSVVVRKSGALTGSPANVIALVGID